METGKPKGQGPENWTGGTDLKTVEPGTNSGRRENKSHVGSGKMCHKRLYKWEKNPADSRKSVPGTWRNKTPETIQWVWEGMTKKTAGGLGTGGGKGGGTNEMKKK